MFVDHYVADDILPRKLFQPIVCFHHARFNQNCMLSIKGKKKLAKQTEIGHLLVSLVNQRTNQPINMLIKSGFFNWQFIFYIYTSYVHKLHCWLNLHKVPEI